MTAGKLTGKQLQKHLDDLKLSQAEAARLLYMTPLALWRLIHGQRKIRGPIIAAIEGWMRHGIPPEAAKRKEEETERKKLAELEGAMKRDRDWMKAMPGRHLVRPR